MTPEMKEFVFQKLRPGFNIMIEARFSAANRLILESGFSRTVDLPCGYTSRGIRFSREDIRYFGMDLPAVIDAVAPAVRELIGGKERQLSCGGCNQLHLTGSCTDRGKRTGLAGKHRPG